MMPWINRIKPCVVLAKNRPGVQAVGRKYGILSHVKVPINNVQEKKTLFSCLENTK